ncbi:hypothetical protein F5B20DRAFT_593572 [Whalleya microplaca]|nr:hypothetical protein F5B20DRAFT_593572 [Whalleya microplaca]
MSPFMNKFTKDVPKDSSRNSAGSLDSGVAMGQNGQNATVTLNFDGPDSQNAVVGLTFAEITMMAGELAAARREGRFPTTSAPVHDPRIVFEDYLRLMALNNARGGAAPEEWNRMANVVELMVNITREIRHRDEVRGEESFDGNVNAHVNNMMSGVDAESHLYRIVQHAVHFAVNNGSGQEGATLTGANMAALLDRIRGVVREMATQGDHGIRDVNMDNVIDDVFGIIDQALTDPTGPLNKNVNKLGGEVKNLGGHINSLDHIAHGQAAQLDAVAGHAKAIDGHVNALGNNINSMGTLIHSTNTNVNALGTQLNILQTIINMVPQMVARALDEMLPQAVQGSFGPLLQAIEARLGVVLPVGGTAVASQGKKKGAKKSKSRKFFGSGFFGFFKKHGGNNGRGPGAGSATV